MMVLWEHGSMTEGELGQIVHLDSGTLAPLLVRMEKQGFIERIKPGNARRQLGNFNFLIGTHFIDITLSRDLVTDMRGFQLFF